MKQKPASTLAVLGEHLDFWGTFLTETYAILSHFSLSCKLCSVVLQKQTWMGQNAYRYWRPPKNTKKKLICMHFCHIFMFFEHLRFGEHYLIPILVLWKRSSTFCNSGTGCTFKIYLFVFVLDAEEVFFTWD